MRKRLFTGVFGLGDDFHPVPALFSKDSSGETRCDDYYKDIFNKLARRNIFADSLASTLLEAPPQSLIWPEVAITPSSIPDNVEDTEYKYHRENKENDLSVLFATITNTYDGLICMKILPNASEIVCGFNNSCIRLWSSTVKDREIEEHAEYFHSVLPVPKDVAHGLVQEDMTLSRSSEQIDSTMFCRQNTLFRCKELRGHSKAVYSLSHDPSARLILSTSADETVRLWDSFNARCLTRYLTNGPCWDVDFGPFGFYFALAHQNRTASVYSTDRDVPLRVFCGHESDVTCCRWHPNAAYVLTGSDDRTVRMWDIRAGSCTSEFVEFVSPISKISISPDGNYFAAGCENGSVAVLDLRFCRRTAILEGHIGPILDVSFSPDSKSLCSGGDDGTVRIWDISSCRVGQVEVFSQASNCFYTKQSQVLTVRYDTANLVYCGGSFSSNSQNSKYRMFFIFIYLVSVTFSSAFQYTGFERQQSSNESDSMNGLGVLAAKKVSSV
jgi:WD40 repeat protein